MAKKNFKGGLDSLIENSLGITKSRKGEMKGNPVDFIKPEQTDDDDEVLAKPRTPQKPVAKNNTEEKGTEATERKGTEGTERKGTEGTEVETEDTEVKSTTEKAEKTEIKKNMETETPTAASTETAEVAASEPVVEAASELVVETVTEPVVDSAPEIDVQPAPETDVEPIDAPSVDTAGETSASKHVVTMNLDASDDDNTKIAYLKEVIADLRHELFLWRNGKINVQTFNATLHTHGLKYNPENNEIEEFDTI